MNAQYVLGKYGGSIHCFETESSSSKVTPYPLGQGLLSWPSQITLYPNQQDNISGIALALYQADLATLVTLIHKQVS